MTRRTYTTEAERLVAEQHALADAQRTGHYQSPISASDARRLESRYTPSLNVPHAGAPAPSDPDPERARLFGQIVREAAATPARDHQHVVNARVQSEVARRLQEAGLDDLVTAGMREAARLRSMGGGW